MAQVYVSLIRKELWRFEQVPERWKAEVQTMLNGGETNG